MDEGQPADSRERAGARNFKNCRNEGAAAMLQLEDA